MLKYIPFVLFAICSSVYSANETVNNRTITQLNSYHDYAVIYFSPSFNNTQNCGPQKHKAIIRYDDNNLDKREMYSLALAAAMSGKTVSLCIYGCDGDHPKVYRVDVKF